MLSRRVFLRCFFFFILVAGVLLVLNSAGIIKAPWPNALSEIFVVLGGLFGFLQWALPISHKANNELKAPQTRFVLSHRRLYSSYVRYEHRDFDVKGLRTQGFFTLFLEHVFVELSISSKSIHETSPDPFKTPDTLRKERYPIWYYLESKKYMHFHLVIIGAPGSGKSTLLKHIALTLADRKKYHQQFRIPSKLPVLLFLRDHVTSLKENSSFSLIDAVQAHLDRWKYPVPLKWVEQQLMRGNCLVMLDGLDEVADPVIRKQMAEWVQRQMVAYARNRFIITSRPHGYRGNQLSGVMVLEVQPFTSEQVEQFIYGWYRAIESMSSQRDDPGVHMKANSEAQDLLQRLYRTPTLYTLTVNPLLLTMIATVHRFRDKLPGKRVALYAEMCEVFLGRRQEARGLKLELSPEQIQRILQPLAYHMMCEKRRDISRTEVLSLLEELLTSVNVQMASDTFLQMIENTNGVFLEREPEIYSFAHSSFQDYLAASHIRENRLEDDLVAHVSEDWWREAICLYCAQADATPVITACLEETPPSVPALILAIQCREEALLPIQPAVSARLDALLSQAAENADPEILKVVGEALLNHRISQMVHLDQETYSATSLISCTEYQMFLDEEQKYGHYHQPYHWTNRHFSPGQGLDPILGISRSDAIAFCDWLTARNHGTWQYRLPKSDELKKIQENTNVAGNLQANTGFWVHGDEGFAWAGDRLQQSNSLILEKIDNTLTSDQNLILDLSAHLPLQSAHLLAYDLKLAGNLERARVLDNALMSTLIFVRDFINNFIRTFEQDLANANSRVSALKQERDNARSHVATLKQRVNNARLQTSQRRHDLANVIANIQTLERTNSRNPALRVAYNRRNEAERDLKNAQDLQEKLENDQELKIAQAQLRKADRQFKEAKAQAHDCEDRLKRVHAYVDTIEQTCQYVFKRSSRYDIQNALVHAAGRNRYLNFDHILAEINDSIFENAPVYISELAHAFAHDLAITLSSDKNNASTIPMDIHDHINVSDLISALSQAYSLASELAAIFAELNIRDLASNLKSNLTHLSRSRPDRIELSQQTRLFIRYFTVVLATHLSHWSWEELFSLRADSSSFINDKELCYDLGHSTIDKYFDVYMTFAILEERIKREISACEGILIVKESRGESSQG